MSDKGKEPAFWHGVVLVAVVAIIWIGIGYYASIQPNPGTFGDMFGAVNALFSGLAFVGVIYAILLQRVELRLQRDELEATRKELAGQKAQMEAQNRTLRKQSFENTFFQLLRLHNEIVNAIDLVKTIARSTRVTKGRDCFRVFYERLQETYGLVSRDKSDHIELTRINVAYMHFYKEHQAELGHYFRNLYNVVKLVKESEIENKRLYTNLIRAQLSSYELLLLFYDCLSDMGNEKFKPLVREFNLLKHCDTALLFSPSHPSLY